MLTTMTTTTLIDTDPLESQEFKHHIRNLLYEYSITHITTNYITFTEDLLAEFLERLKPIPLTDPYSFTLLPDPFKAFSQIHSLSTLAPYDEIPETTQEALAYIKRCGAIPKGTPRTEKMQKQWSDDSYQPPPEEFIPALTRKARRATPKLGKKSKPACHQTFRALVEHGKITQVSVESVQEPKLIPEEILQTAHDINPDDLPAVQALLRSAADAIRPRKDYKNPYLDPAFLRTQFSGPAEYKPLEEEFVPLFPRSRVPALESGRSSDLGGGGGAGVLPELRSFADISSVSSLRKVEVEDPDPDISKQNMVVVDGWETIRSSPPSSPSSSDSDNEEDQLNELFLHSSPPTTDPPLVEEIENAKMEEILIPRSRKVGGKAGVMPHILAGKTLQSFLSPLLSRPNVQPDSAARTPSDEKSTSGEVNGGKTPLPPSSPTPSSLVGQPPSVLQVDGHDDGENEKVEIRADRDLDTELRDLYGGRVEELQEMIMNEKIEDKRESMLWEVPDLPPPTVRPARSDANWLHVPKIFSDFLVPPSKNAISDAQRSRLELKPPHQFLKKARGRQSLGLALSWIPFTVDKKLPSVHELVGVEDLLDDVSTSTIKAAEVDGLFKALKIDAGPAEALEPLESEEQGNARLFSHSWLEKEECRPPEAYSFLSERFQIMLTRQEQRRLAKAEGRVVECDDDEEKEEKEAELRGEGVAYGVDVYIDDVPPSVDAGGVQIRVDEEVGRQVSEDGHIHQDDARPRKRPRLAHEEEEHVVRGGDGDTVLHIAGGRQLQPRPTFRERSPFTVDDFDYEHADQPAVAFHASYERAGDEDRLYEGEDGDKENFPPPTSSYTSSTYVCDGGRDVDGVGFDYDYRGEYQEGGHGGQIGRPYGGYYYNWDGEQPYHLSGVAVDHKDVSTTIDDSQEDSAIGIPDYHPENEGGSFEPLSFGSQFAFPAGQIQASTILPTGIGILNRGSQEVVAEENQRVFGGASMVSDSMLLDDEEKGGTAIAPDPPPLSYEPEIASKSLGISAFAHLRARKVSAPAAAAEIVPPPAPDLSVSAPLNQVRQLGVPPELVDKDTLVLSTLSLPPPCSIHRYMASLDLIQKHALVRALRSERCAVDLVERRSLGGVDLILDPYCAVIFLSLFTLPAKCDAYVDRVSKQSWKYVHLLIVFEAYPEQLSKRAKPSKVGGSTGVSLSFSDLYAYTPPIVKAIKRFRRDINIAGACGSKRAETKVQYAFADNVHEAALSTRWFGDLAEENDRTGGVIWGERRWLAEDCSEEEVDCLAGVNGLNHFSASIILSQMALQEYLHLTPEGRAEVCGGMIADEMIDESNADIENRLRSIDGSSDDLR